jgi:hypothetical protein
MPKERDACLLELVLSCLLFGTPLHCKCYLVQKTNQLLISKEISFDSWWLFWENFEFKSRCFEKCYGHFFL